MFGCLSILVVLSYVCSFHLQMRGMCRVCCWLRDFLKKLEFLVVWLPLCVAVIMDPFFFIIVIGLGW